MTDSTQNTPAQRPATPTNVSPFKAFQDEMDRMFHAFSMPQMPWRFGAGSGDGSLGLRVDISETDNEIQVQADLPGVAESDVDITLDDDLLRIRAEKKSESSARTACSSGRSVCRPESIRTKSPPNSTRASSP